MTNRAGSTFHAFLWWIGDSRRLSDRAFDLIADDSHEVFVSAVSVWEIATRYRIGRLPVPELAAFDMAGAIAGQGFRELAIGVRDASLAGRLPGPHRDPFDRMLSAQALTRDLLVVSRDAVFDEYRVSRVW